jgi:predicted dehydrogenase
VRTHAVFGLIGAGGLGQSQHLPNLTRARNATLKSVCDLKPALLEFAQSKYGIAHVTQDHRELLADPEIDAVVIATRADAHIALAIAALRAGKHVYVEKPLAETAEECERLLPIQRESGRILAVGHNRRMAPAFQMLRKVLRAHGGAKNIHYRITDDLYLWGPEAGVEPGTRVVHEVCHIFDLLRYLAESEITSVYCAASRPDDEIVALKFASGCVATIMSSGCMTRDMPKERLEVVVDIGGAIVEEFVELRTFGLSDFDPVYRFAGRVHPDYDMMHRYLFEKQGAQAMLDIRRIFWEKSERLEELKRIGAQTPERRELEEYLLVNAPSCNYMVDKGWQAAIEHLADCILLGTPCELSTAEDGLRAAMLAQATIDSRNSGQVVQTSVKPVDGRVVEPRVEVTVGKPPAVRRPRVGAN